MDKLKKVILSLKFVKDALHEAEIQAFPKAHKDILETMRDDLDKKSEELAKQKLNDMLSIVDMKKVVTIDKQHGIVFIGGERIDENRLANLKSETEFLMQSDIWQLLYETPKELAQRSMFVSGESLADMQKGKSMLYLLSSQKNILDIFKSYTPKK